MPVSPANLAPNSHAFFNSNVNGADRGEIATAASYPYTHTYNGCSATGKPAAASITSYDYVDWQDDAALAANVVAQPTAILVDAGNTLWQFYDGGIIDNAYCASSVTDGALAVGYGVDDSVPYFKIKYFFGTAWGEDGYIRVKRDDTVNWGYGYCGIYAMPLSIQV